MRVPYRHWLLLLLILSCQIQTYATDTTQVAVQFKSGSYTLHGKLILPKQGQKVPAVVFVVGEGDNSSYRNSYQEWIAENLEKPLLPEGIAILLFDKRGISPSEGLWYKTNFDEQAADVKAAIDFLKQHPSIDTSRIGVIGHSHGGWVAQLAASRYPDEVAFGVSMAGAPYGVKRQLINDYTSELLCKQLDPAEARQKAERKTQLLLRQVAVYAAKEEHKMLDLIKDFEPAPFIQDLKTPFLFLFAENDGLVFSEWAEKELKTLFPAGMPAHINYRIIPEANHSFRRAPFCYDGSWEDMPYSEASQQTLKEWILLKLQKKEMAEMEKPR